MSEPLRIALHVEGRRIRGNEQQLLYLVEQLVARGHELHVACPGGTAVAEAFRRLGARVSGARPRGDVDPVSLLRYVRWLRGVRPHGIVLSSWKRAAIAAAGARMARVPRIILRVGGPHGWKGGAGDRLRRRALRRWIDAVWTNSQEIAAQVDAYAGGLPGDALHVIPNAVPRVDAALPALRQALGAQPGERVVFTAAGLEKNKGHDVLLRALAALPPEVHLAIAGDGPERAALAALASRLGIAGRVHLLGHRLDVPALLADADAFALATRADSTPNAALEAMAAGLPVVITDVPGSSGMLAAAAPEPLGWVVPGDRPDALAAALRAALGPEGRSRGARARERVLRERTPERLGRQVELLLRGMFPAATSPS